MRETNATHRMASVLFCVGDTICDVARMTTGSEFESLYAVACTHYAAIEQSNIHVGLAHDYFGATLDTWAREVCHVCVVCSDFC